MEIHWVKCCVSGLWGECWGLTSCSCFISTLFSLDLWGFSSSIANGRPDNQNKNTSFVSFQVTKSSVCVKILPFPRVRTSTSSLPDEEKLKPVTKQKRRLSGHIHYLFIVQITVLKQLTLKLTAGSEGRQDGCCDQLLHRGLHPPLSIDHPGSLRQTATELVVPP